MKWYDKFKVGDKVRVLNRPKWKHGDGEIINIDKNGCVLVKYDTSTCVLCDGENCGYTVTSRWYRPTSVERVVKKNQQLLFDFMR